MAKDKSITPLVINTRPSPQNAHFSKRLREAGFEVEERPLLTIIPTNVPKPTRLQAAGSAIITSAHAVHKLAQLPENERQNIFCVGPSSTEAAREIGMRNIRIGPGNAQDLAEMICAEKPAGRLLYLCAMRQAFDMKTALSRCGIHCEMWPVYSAIDPDPGKWGAAIQQYNRPVWVTLTSARLAQNFLKICPQPVGNIRIAAISTAVANVLPKDWRERTHISLQTNTNSILHLLKKQR